MKKNDKKSVIRKIAPYFVPHIGKFILAVISMIVVTSVHLARPMILRAIIDEAIPSSDITLALKYALFFIISLLVGAAAMYLRVKIMALLGAEVVAKIKKEVYEHVLAQDMSFFDRNQTGKLITRTESDANQLKSLFTQSTAQLVASSMLVIGTILVLLREDLYIGLAAFIAMILLFFGLSFYLNYVRSVHTQAREKNSELTGYLAEYLQGVPLIQIHGREEKILENLQGYNRKKAALEYKAAFLEYPVFATTFRFVTEVGSIALLFAYCSNSVFDGSMTVGSFIMYIELLRQFFRPIEFLVEVLGQLQHALAAGVKVFDILDTKTKVPDNGSPHPNLKLIDKIDFCDLSFAYEQDLVLKNVSFSIERGTQVAIVGSSGSGKTTCISLLLRFYDPLSGSIKIDNKDIRDISLHDWRRQIALVLQEIYLFPGTIMDNLKAFHPDVSDETVIGAAKKLGAHDFILKQPNGYDSILAERGANLSFGERQLLSYIRALVKDPEILILDEATSSVDLITERALQSAMDKLMVNRTAIIIAHRLSTIRNADKILVFDKGELNQLGDHDSLMQEGGIYKELVTIQEHPEVISPVNEHSETGGAVA